MNIEKQIADQVRSLSDKDLAAMALSSGFSIALRKDKAPSSQPATVPDGAKRRVKAEAKQPKELSLEHPYYKVLARLQAAGKEGLGMSAGDLVLLCDSCTKGDIAKGLKVGIDKGTIFKGGDRRFTRYGDTQKIADDSSLAARAG